LLLVLVLALLLLLLVLVLEVLLSLLETLFALGVGRGFEGVCTAIASTVRVSWWFSQLTPSPEITSEEHTIWGGLEDDEAGGAGEDAVDLRVRPTILKGCLWDGTSFMERWYKEEKSTNEDVGEEWHTRRELKECVSSGNRDMAWISFR
jgi:hypothetical protein